MIMSLRDTLVEAYGIALGVAVPWTIWSFWSLRYRPTNRFTKVLAAAVERASTAFRETWDAAPVAATLDVTIDPLGRSDIGDAALYPDGTYWRFEYADLLGKRLTVRGCKVVGVVDVSKGSDGYVYWARRGEAG